MTLNAHEQIFNNEINAYMKLTIPANQIKWTS